MSAASPSVTSAPPRKAEHAHRKPAPERRARRGVGRLLRIGLYALIVVVFAGPLVGIFSTAFSSTVHRPGELVFLPGSFTLDQLDTAFGRGVGRYLFNSVVVVTVGLVLQVGVSALAAYSLARKKFRGAGVVLLLILSTMMLPEEVIAIPLYLVLSDVPIAPGLDVSLLNTYAGMILPLVGWAFSIFILTQFMRAIPLELEESARIDGAGELTIFFRIILPLCRPALGTAAVFGFIMIWDQYLLPLLVAQDPQMATITVALAQFHQTADTENVGAGLIMAVSFLAMVPTILAYLAMQRFYNRGLLTGAVKG
jgi:multiple sugar transport system permease protein